MVALLNRDEFENIYTHFRDNGSYFAWKRGDDVQGKKSVSDGIFGNSSKSGLVDVRGCCAFPSDDGLRADQFNK